MRKERTKTLPLNSEIKEILTYEWNGDLKDTISKLKKITLLTTGLKWEFNPNNEISKENNRILNQCLQQYKNGYKHFMFLTQFKEIKNGKTKLIKRKIIGLYGYYIFW